MSKKMADFYVDGTAALKVEYADNKTSAPSFTAFDCSYNRRSQQPPAPCPRPEGARARRTRKRSFKDSARSVFERSEMACSLLFEDVRGVPYHAFSKANIATLSVATSAIAIVSLVLGA